MTSNASLQQHQGGLQPVKNDLTFITVTEPSKFSDKTARRQIRSHAMHEYVDRMRENDEPIRRRRKRKVDTRRRPPSDVMPKLPPPFRVRAWSRFDSFVDLFPILQHETKVARALAPKDDLPISDLLLPIIEIAMQAGYCTTQDPMIQYDPTLAQVFSKVHCPLGLPHAIWGSVDPFFAMPKFTSAKLNTGSMYYHCLGAFGRVGKSPEWIGGMINTRLGFLSSLYVATTHLDMLRNLRKDSVETTTAKAEIIQLVNEAISDEATRTTDLTIMSICHLVTSEIKEADNTVLLMHMKGLLWLVKLRGGLDKLGYNGELGMIVQAKILYTCVFNELVCPEEYMSFTQTVKPHRPFKHTIYSPPSPLYVAPLTQGLNVLENSSFGALKSSLRCGSEVVAILQDMKLLTEMFLERYESKAKELGETESTTSSSFDDTISGIITRLKTRPSSTVPNTPVAENHYYEVVRIAALLYTSALFRRLPISVVSGLLYTPHSPSLPSQLLTALFKTNICRFWGEAAGVLIWACLVGATAANGLVRGRAWENVVFADENARRWLTNMAMGCMVILASEHATMVMGNLKTMLRIQRILGAAEKW